MATLIYPDFSFGPAEWLLDLRPRTQVFASPFTDFVQTAGIAGATPWVGSIQYQALRPREHEELKAFLHRLRGRSGRFLIHDLRRPTPVGVGGNGAVVAGDGHTGGMVTTRGWPVNSAVLVPGDRIGIGGELKSVVAHCNSDGGGNATIEFEPPFRNTQDDGVAIITDRPTVTVLLGEDRAKDVRGAAQGLRDVSFTVLEDI